MAKERPTSIRLGVCFSRAFCVVFLGFGCCERPSRLLEYREHVDAGGLVSYGVDLPWCFKHAATLVDKILRGAPVAEVAVEFPTKLVMV